MIRGNGLVLILATIYGTGPEENVLAQRIPWLSSLTVNLREREAEKNYDWKEGKKSRHFLK
jgi:hypothetical protein